MAVTYTKGNANWQNYPTLSTPITEDKLDNFETGIDQIYGLAVAKGDLISGSSSRNLVNTTAGANDTLLVADSAQTGGIKWAKVGMGQLATGVGTNDTVLVADSGQAAGAKWVQVGNSQIIANAGIALSKLETGAWDTYTPTLTASTSNPTLGSGSTATGRYIKLGRRTMIITANIQFGTSGVAAGSGFYFISVPETLTSTLVWGNGVLIDSGGSNYVVACVADSTTRLALYEAFTKSPVTNASPFVWAASDRICINLTVETAA